MLGKEERNSALSISVGKISGVEFSTFLQMTSQCKNLFEFCCSDIILNATWWYYYDNIDDSVLLLKRDSPHLMILEFENPGSDIFLVDDFIL